MRVFLERPSPRRRDEFLALARASRKLHRPWVTAPRIAEEFDDYLKRHRRPDTRSFFICAGRDGGLAGVANLSEIVRGPLQSAYLGFYAFAPSARRGLMTAGLALVLDAAFGVLKLHRVEANIQPANEPSKRLVARLGFRLEGYSPRYLKIGGRWCDHERWAVLREEWRAARRGGRRSDAT